MTTATDNQQMPETTAETLPWPLLLPWLATRLVGLRLALWLAVAAWFLWPWLQNPYQLGTAHDAAYFLHHSEAAWRSWAQYGELPAWNPWFCGGIPALGNLQESSLSPTMILPVLFGLMPGNALILLLYFAAGMEGAWRYARRWGATRTSAVVAALVFALSGRFATMFLDGQPAFVGFQLTPWVLLGFEAGMTSLWAAVGGGAAMALIFLEGGAVATPMLGVLLLWLVPLHTLGRLVPWPGTGPRWRTAHKPLMSLVIIGLVAVGLTAVRLGPVVESLARWPREWHADALFNGQAVWAMLTAPANDGGYDGPGTSYIGVFVVAAGAWALLRRPLRGWPLLLFVAVTVGLAMGHQRPWAPWALTTKLPVLHNLRCPFRMTFFTALFVATLAAVSIGALQRDLRDGLARLLGAHKPASRLWKQALPWALAGVLAAAGVVAIAQQPARFNRARWQLNGFEAAPRWVEQPFRQSIGNRWEAHLWPALGMGSLACFEEQPYPTTAALRGDLPAEEYLTDPKAGTVMRTSWSPHRIALDVRLDRPAVLRVNQNFHRAWKSSHGKVFADNGVLAVQLPAGHYALVVRHRDPLVWAGLFVSLTTAIGLLLAWLLARRRAEAGPPGRSGHITIVRPRLQ